MPDIVTHTCISYVVAKHCYPDNKSLFMLSSLAPDIDVVFGGFYILLFVTLPLSIPDFFKKALIFHPTVPASLFFVPIFAFLVTLFFALIKRDMLAIGYKRSYTIVLNGILLHLALDLLQTGNKPFWPFNIEMGFDILPYSVKGRLITVGAALTIVFIDGVCSNFLSQYRMKKPT